MTTKLDDEVRALFNRYEGDELHALLAACGLRFAVDHPIPFEKPGYVRPTTRPLTDDEHAAMAKLDARLLAQWPCPTPAPTAAERFAELRERQAHESPATGARARLQRQRDRVRYGVRRLRAGNEWRWQRPLAAVRAETAVALRQLGHAELARRIAGL